MKYKTAFKVLFVIFVGSFLFAGSARAATPTITNAKITGPYKVVLYFSEPVITAFSDYSNFTGSLSGRNLTGISGSGTSQIGLTFDGGPFPSSSIGGLTISNNTKSISDNSTFNTGYVSITDGQAPTVSSFSISSNNYTGSFTGPQNILTLTFNLNESVKAPNISIGGYIVSVGGSGSGPFTVNYTMTGVETLPVPVMATFTDTSGNATQLSLTLGTSVSANQLLSSVTSSASSPGVLKSGDNIVFTLTPSTPQPGATVTGAYNGVLLTWTTSNGGATYTATYHVNGGDSDQSTPLQISGVTITTSNGLTSAPISGTDVKMTIDTHGPVLTMNSTMPNVTSASPTFSFLSNEVGTLVFYGDCTSSMTSAVFGNNSIVFNSLTNGVHGNCLVGERDTAGNLSNLLPVGAFTVTGGSNTAAATIPAVTTPATTPTTSTGSASTSSYKFYSPLKVGSTGIEVTELQKRLIAGGYLSGSATGYYGTLTEAAVKKYQTAHGLSPLGTVGPGTRAALNQ